MHPPHEGHGARETRDVLWTYHSAELFQLLVLQRAGRRVVYGNSAGSSRAHFYRLIQP